MYNVGYNICTLVGRVHKEPNKTYTPQGTAKIRFTMAVPRPSKDKEDAVDYAFITAWGEKAEGLFSLLVPGQWVVMSGSYRKSSYKKDNAWVDDIHFEANSVVILGELAAVEDEEGINGAPVTSYDEDIPF